MDKWNEMRTAYQVAKLGTVSAAAKALDVHRATVIRHIDALEAELESKLFERSLQGYLPTAAGYDLLQVAEVAEEQFSRLALRTQKHRHELEGDFIVTSLDIAAPLILPTLHAFKQQHPKIDIKYVTSEDLFKLEFGHAHFAIRTGDKPQKEDYLVQPFREVKLGLYAHQDYLAQKSPLKSLADISRHHFIGFMNYHSKFADHGWLQKNVPATQMIMHSNSRLVHANAILEGMGIGFMIASDAQKHPVLQEVLQHETDLWVTHWQLIHKDVQHSKKIQAFLEILNAHKSNANNLD